MLRLPACPGTIQKTVPEPPSLVKARFGNGCLSLLTVFNDSQRSFALLLFIVVHLATVANGFDWLSKFSTLVTTFDFTTFKLSQNSVEGAD
mmetsp:Transcript_33310/g.58739  ORF Transcript_33310/g.58739 Transcript_33310/m.58739 type:complete len:91 (-) Transcript_33310:8-280(-)